MNIVSAFYFCMTDRSGSRTAATSMMELEAVDYCHKECHLRSCRSPRSASDGLQFIATFIDVFLKNCENVVPEFRNKRGSFFYHSQNYVILNATLFPGFVATAVVLMTAKLFFVAIIKNIGIARNHENEVLPECYHISAFCIADREQYMFVILQFKC